VVSFYFYSSFSSAASLLAVCVRWCVVVVWCGVVYGGVCCGVLLCTLLLSKVWVSAVEFGSRHWLLSATSSAPVSAPIPAPVQLQAPSKNTRIKAFLSCGIICSD
jgi:hypothetical protein